MIINRIKWFQEKLEMDSVKLENQNLMRNNKQLEHEIKILKQLLDIEQSNTRLAKYK